MASSTSTQPATGDKAPKFSAPADNGEKISLSQFKGKYVILYFYPKDNTPGCTIEAKEFRDALEEFESANAVVLGISPDSIDSHCKFVERFGLNFRLLVDDGHAVAEKYGVWVEKNLYGKKSMGVQRATFLIDPKGVIAQTWPKVKAEGHAEQVLKAVLAHGQ